MFVAMKRSRGGVKGQRGGGMRRRMAEDEEQESDGEGGRRVGRGPSSKEREREREHEDRLNGTGGNVGNKILQSQSDATRSIEIDTAFDRDARALKEQRLKLAKERLDGVASSSGGERTAGNNSVASEGKQEIYKGVNSYTDYKAAFRREQVVGNKASGSHGPARASANVRISYRMDYQPDICKDYKETGYCGYGDACKFLHDRSDYKSGWELDREWEEKQKARQKMMEAGVELGEDGDGSGDGGRSTEDELPFACLICRKPFTDPVVTRCKHYFCEHCALKHNAKSPNCFACGKPTSGIFNVAREIIRKQNATKRLMCPPCP